MVTGNNCRLRHRRDFERQNMSKIPSKDVAKLAADSGLGVKAVDRLMGSIRIPIDKLHTPGARQQMATDALTHSEAGLQLDGPDVLAPLVMKLGQEQVLTVFADVLRQFGAQCAIFCTWVGRGDFNPERPPAELGPAALTHAARTAARLRAQALRQGN